MQSAILHFDNLESNAHIRAIVRDDQPLFVAKDICESLGIANSKAAVGELEADERITLTPSDLDPKVGNPDLRKPVLRGDSSHLRMPNRGLQFVTESGLYALIFKSRKEAARKFRVWVTSEVLPAIRRAGRYDVAEAAAGKPASLAFALYEARISDLEVEVIRLRAKADEDCSLPGHLTVQQFAALAGLGISGVAMGHLSNRAHRVCAERGIPMGRRRTIILPDGRRKRLTRPAHTYPETVLRELTPAA
jgi:prophage antirepressor-like protein